MLKHRNGYEKNIKEKYTGKHMKYEVTSYNTKKMLGNALKKLMQKKPLNKISISEITSECGVNRKTFYYHFEDIYNLLMWVFDEEAVEVVKCFYSISDYEDAIYYVMDYVEKNDYLINCTLDAIGQEGMKRFFIKDFIEYNHQLIDNVENELNKKLPNDIKQFLIVYISEAIAGLLLDWIRGNTHLDKDKYVKYMVLITGNIIRSTILL